MSVLEILERLCGVPMSVLEIPERLCGVPTSELEIPERQCAFRGADLSEERLVVCHAEGLWQLGIELAGPEAA